MSSHSWAKLTSQQIASALAVGTVAVLMVGIQPIVLGALVDAHRVTLEGVGVVAMGEIVALGLGVIIGDVWLPPARLRAITLLSCILAAIFDLLTTRALGDGPVIAARAGAGLAEGMLVWGATAVIVRSSNPSRVAGLFFVTQTLGQAAVGFLLATLVIPAWGWQGAFELLAILSLVTCGLAFSQPATLATMDLEEMMDFRWSRRTLMPLLVVFLQLMALGSFWAYLEPISKAIGLTAAQAQTLIAAVLGTQVLGGTVASLAIKRVATPLALTASSAVLLGCVAATRALPPGSVVSFALACGLFGFAWLFMLPFQVDLALQADETKRVAGLVPAAQLLGCAVGPLMASFSVHGEDASAVPALSMTLAAASIVAITLTGRQARVRLA